MKNRAPINSICAKDVQLVNIISMFFIVTISVLIAPPATHLVLTINIIIFFGLISCKYPRNRKISRPASDKFVFEIGLLPSIFMLVFFGTLHWILMHARGIHDDKLIVAIIFMSVLITISFTKIIQDTINMISKLRRNN